MSLHLKRTMTVAVALAAMAAGGAVIGNAATSKAMTTPTTTTSATSATIPAHGTTAHESAETTVTGDAATQAQAAAVKAVGSGTAGTVTTDFHGGGYEVTVTKSDGSTTEVHLDSSFNIQGGPGGTHGRPGGPPQSGSSSSYGPGISG